MPLVRIEMLKGKGTEYKEAIMDSVHRALVDAFKIPEGDRMQRLYELDRDHFHISNNKTEDCIIIELTVFKGRSYEAKKKLYGNIAANLYKSLGIRREDVVVVIYEPTLDNWGLAGKPASEGEIGFDINV